MMIVNHMTINDYNVATADDDDDDDDAGDCC